MQWPINQKLYVGCRIIVSLALIGWFLADIIYESETFYQDRTWTYAVYATNWSFFLLVITSVYQTVCSLVYTAKSTDNLGNVMVFISLSCCKFWINRVTLKCIFLSPSYLNFKILYYIYDILNFQIIEVEGIINITGIKTK